MTYNYALIGRIRDLMMEKKLTMAVAESVTAGHLQAALSSALEASSFFQGGITAYNLGQKARHLDVDPIACEQNDSVSDDIAKIMALGAARLFLSDYGIAITGYATPVPEKGIHDTFAWFAIAHKKEILFCEKITTGEDRVNAQIDYTNQVLEQFVSVVEMKVNG